MEYSKILLEYSKLLLEYSKLLLEYSQKVAEDVFRSKEQRKMDFPLVICSLIRTFAAENETDGEKTYCIVDAVGGIPANADVVVVALSRGNTDHRNGV